MKSVKYVLINSNLWDNNTGEESKLDWIDIKDFNTDTSVEGELCFDKLFCLQFNILFNVIYSNHEYEEMIFEN